MRPSVRQLARSSAAAPRWGPIWAQRAPHTSTLVVHSSAAASGGTSSAPSTMPNNPSSTSNSTQTQPTGPPGGPVVPPVAAAEQLADLPFYSQFPLDRRDDLRRDQKRLDELFTRPDAKLIPLLRDMVLVQMPAAGAAPADSTGSTAAAAPLLRPVLLSPAAAHADLAASSPARVFLGVDAHGAPYFAAAVGSPATGRDLAATQPGAEWRSARAAGPDLTPGDASLLAVASGLMVWHGANGFSPGTGAPTTSTPGGFSRRCTAGGGSVYPRIDPAVIMLVSHRGFALLGRKAEWPTDRYSTLAGFLELGEPLEAAVAREVEEEAGVKVNLGSVTYAASQPWPFPRSLMIGFHADAAAAPAGAAAARGGGAGAQSGGNGAVSGASSSSNNSSSGHSPPTARPWWQPAPAPAAGFDLLPLQGRRAALDTGIFKEEVEEALGPLQGIQWPSADEDELQDVRWFHRDWLRSVFRAPGGALTVPGAGQFNIPGPYSLAYRLITTWVGSVPGGGGVPPAGAAAAASAGADTAAWMGDAVPQVMVSSSGTFKYVLARLWDPSAEGEGRSKLLVWGDVRAPYHNDVLQKAKALARPLGLQVTPLGGGRINHDPAARALQVYGYSAAFGPAPHEVTAAILHRWFPLYDRQSITVSYDGY